MRMALQAYFGLVLRGLVLRKEQGVIRHIREDSRAPNLWYWMRIGGVRGSANVGLHSTTRAACARSRANKKRQRAGLLYKAKCLRSFDERVLESAYRNMIQTSTSVGLDRTLEYLGRISIAPVDLAYKKMKPFRFSAHAQQTYLRS
jgi:hypothetical protein